MRLQFCERRERDSPPLRSEVVKKRVTWRQKRTGESMCLSLKPSRIICRGRGRDLCVQPQVANFMRDREALTVTGNIRTLSTHADVGSPVDVVRDSEMATDLIPKGQHKTAQALCCPDCIPDWRVFGDLGLCPHFECELLDRIVVADVSIEARDPICDSLETGSLHPIVCNNIVSGDALNRLRRCIRIGPQPRTCRKHVH